jgi:UDP-glucose 4-epimerase
MGEYSMKVVVTGSKGLIGSNLVRVLEDLGHSVMGIDKNGGIDLNHPEDIEKAFHMFKPEVIYMLAAEAAESTSQISPIHMTNNNIGIFNNTLKASINAGVKKFIYTSSVAVYGEARTPYREDGPTIPKDIYGINKLACEQMLKVMAKVYNFDYVIFRPHNIYGPGQNMADPARNVVALFMRNIIEGKTSKLFGNGTMRRAFSYVDDVVEKMAVPLDRDEVNGFTINLGSTKDISIKELFDAVQKVSGKKAKVEKLPARPQEVEMFLADHFLQSKIFDYHETSLEDGLKKTWEWVNSQPLPPIMNREREICLDQK